LPAVQMVLFSERIIANALIHGGHMPTVSA
jgi:hypothetical protein